jgi:type I restriction enzyme S subunit
MSFPRYPSYKDSGVEWLGQVPEHWEIAPPKWHVRSAAGGTSIKGSCADEPAEGLFPGFSASGQDVWLEAPDFNGPGIVLSAVGARCGKTFKANGAWGVVANTHCLFPIHGTDCDYLWYVTNREDWWEKGGSAQPFVKVSDTLARKWVFPPAAEQTQIAEFLDRETGKIDELVAEQRRLMELLKEKRQAVISHAVTRGLNPAAPLKPSGIEWLGSIPTHWQLKRLKHVTIPVRGIQMGPFGGMLKDLKTEPTTFKLYGQENTINDDFACGSRWLSEEHFESLREYELQPGDLVLTRKGASIGNCRVVPADIQRGVIDSDTIRVRLDSEVIAIGFAVILMHEGYMESAILQRQKGSVLPGLNTDTIANLPIAIPPPGEQRSILAFLTEQMARFDTLTAEAQRAIDLLQERRTALISAAVTGQIDVREAG